MQSPIERLLHWAYTKPDALALLGDNERVTYAELLSSVRDRATWLHHMGVRAGDTVALGLAPPAEFCLREVALFYAIAYLGALILPLYPEVILERRGPLADQLGAQWLVSGPLPNTCRARLIDPALYAARPVHQRTPPHGDSPHAPFFYEFTSGTTGKPKLMRFSGAESVARVLSSAMPFGWQGSDAMVLPLRWPTKVGVKGVVRALVLGATYVHTPFPETRQALSQLIRRLGVTCVGSSPWQLRRLLTSALLPEGNMPPLRVLGTAGAFVAPHEVLAARRTLTANFHVGYGTTEIGLMGHLGPEDPPDAPLRIVKGMEGQALDEQGQPLPAGQVGQLRFRTDWIPKAYAKAEASVRDGFHGGWFVTNDLGAVDAMGRITLLGRVDDAINCGGAKIQPQEVEQALAAHPDVADVAVVGVPDAMAGEIAVAFLVLKHPIPMDALMIFLTPLLEPHQVPAAFAGMDAIPRNPEGKVLRSALRDFYTANTGQHPPLP